MSKKKQLEKARAKRKSEKERHRKKIAAAHLQSDRVPSSMRAESKDIDTELRGIQDDVLDQLRNIESVKSIAVSMYKLTDKIVSLRLDIPYLTNSQKKLFTDYKERITTICDTIVELKENMLKAAENLRATDTAGGTLTKPEEYLNKYKRVIDASTGVLELSSQFVVVHNDLAAYSEDLLSLIEECNKLRIDTNNTSIMPIASEEELAPFKTYTGTEVQETISKTHEDMKEDGIKRIGSAAADAMSHPDPENPKSIDSVLVDSMSVANYIGNEEYDKFKKNHDEVSKMDSLSSEDTTETTTAEDADILVDETVSTTEQVAPTLEETVAPVVDVQDDVVDTPDETDPTDIGEPARPETHGVTVIKSV